MENIKSALTNPKVVFSIYLLIGLYISISQLIGYYYGFWHKPYTPYNDFIIFKNSFIHLIQNKDLYALYPSEQFDQFKYSPTFAFLMLPFWYLPNFLGLILWDLLNIVTLVFAVLALPLKERSYNVGILWCILPMLFAAIRAAETNALMAGLIILAFSMLEKERWKIATFLIVLSVYIKIFSIVEIALFLLYPQKIKLGLYTCLWFLILGLLPLLAISPHQLHVLYLSWSQLLQVDHGGSFGLSLMGLLHAWFNLDISKYLVVLVGVILFGLPYLQRKNYHDKAFRLLALASVLMWVIIFNHKTETSTLIIAMGGAAIWYYAQASSQMRIGLLFLVLLLMPFARYFVTGFSYLLGQFPLTQEQMDKFKLLEVLPVIIVWLTLTYESIFPSCRLKAE